MGRPVGAAQRKSDRNTKEKLTEESSNTKQRKNNKLNKKEHLRTLLKKLDDILRPQLEVNETEKDSAGVVERAAKYIVELENELGPEAIASLHKDPEFSKSLKRK